MASTIKSLINRFYPQSPAKVLITGSDYSGKTTLLYLLKCGEIVQTIPSIGFNVENISVPLPSTGKELQVEGWDLGTGCGGMRYLRMVIRFYLPTSKAVVWMVDSSRGMDELEESAQTLEAILAMDDAETTESRTARQIPILILANKADLPNGLSLDQVRTTFARATKGRITSVYRTSVVKGEGLTEAFEWLNLALEIAATGKFGSTPKDDGLGKNLREPSVLAKRLEGWLHQTEADLPAEEFIAKFKAYDLPTWDHYTHIRLAYLILMAHGRQKGKDMIFEGLPKYIANNPQTNTRGFHFSMTYFWIQMVHFGIRNIPPALVQSESNAEGGDNEVKYPSSAEFFMFLLVNPHLADGNIWADYYSKEVLMSVEAKERMVLPDKKPLPSLVVRDAIRTLGSKR